MVHIDTFEYAINCTLVNEGVHDVCQHGWTYDKSPTVSLIEFGKTHLLVLDTLS
jgi:hypothetical protein